jgi:hypothetical protein
MPSNHALDPATFNDPISLLDGSDVQSATALRAMLEAIADNTAFLRANVATQAEQETGTSTTKFVTPGRQHSHPSAAKFWAYVTVSAGAPTLAASYNVTSISDTGAGALAVTIATDFSGVNWAPSATLRSLASPLIVSIASQAAGTVDLLSRNTAGAATDPDAWAVHGFGDQ